MMSNNYAKAYKELLEIIKHFPLEEYNKIPKEKIKFYEENMDKNYHCTINSSCPKEYPILITSQLECIKNNMIEVSEKIKKISNEEIGVENKDYIKEVNKDKINYMMDALVEIQNMMNVINTNNKKNLNIVNGMQKEVDRILKKNEI